MFEWPRWFAGLGVLGAIALAACTSNDVSSGGWGGSDSGSDVSHGDGAPDTGGPDGGGRDASDDATNDVAEAGDDAAEAGPDAPVETGPTERMVFVSSALYDGNLGGLSGADAKCQALATNAGLAGTYKAWLSDSASPAVNRFTHSTVPYVLVDHTTVANDYFTLTGGGPLLHAIDLTETGQAAPVGTCQCSSQGSIPTVWTYTNADGTQFGSGNCSDWTSSSGARPLVGEANTALSPWWTNYCGSYYHTCSDTAALYCFQQ
jgi:hypothetical protein